MAGVMPAVWRGNYVMELDKDEGTSILNSYRFSQSTCASRNLPQWRYESSCLDFRICHRHADSCVFLPSSSPHSSSIYPFFRFPVSNSAKLHAVLPLPGSSFPASFLFVLFLSSYAVFWIFILLPFSAFRPFPRTDSMVELLPVFLLRELLRISGPSWKATNSPPYPAWEWTSGRRRTFRKITLGIAM